MKLITWNVNGLRAIIKKDLLRIMSELDADIFCFQETRINSEKDIPKTDYYAYCVYAKKPGYSGVCVFSKKKPLSVIEGLGIKEFDDEARVLTLEFDDFFVVDAYFPNSQHGLKRLDYKLAFNNALLNFIKKLKKHVILCGDFNVAHKEIDLKNPKSNINNPGFYIDERNSFEVFLKSGFVDVFRHFDKSPERYTWWSYRFNARKNNVGWRIDYFLIDKDFLKSVESCKILSQVYGSDHCPVELVLR